jgi:hypothetical protein
LESKKMRDLLLVILAFLVRPVPWLLPGDMTLPFVVWVVAFIISLATLVWLLRQAIRVIRRGP